MGVIKAELMKSSGVHVVSRDSLSTQICPICGKLTRQPLSQRNYTCSHFGYHHSSRDRKAAISILSEAMRINMLSGTESTKSRGGQSQYSRQIVIYIGASSLPVKREACVLGHRQFTATP